MLYLASSAVLTRLGIASVRVWQNSPSKNKNPEYNRVDKFSALWERIFVEIFGTLGYMATIHAGMDVAANFFEKNIKLPLFDTSKNVVKAFPGMSKGDTVSMLNKVNDALKHVYGQSHKGEVHGVIDRAIFGPAPGKAATRRRFLDTLKDKGVNLRNPDIEKFIMGHIDKKGSIEHFISKVNYRCAATWGIGILLGALFGGVVIQFVNDRIFAPYVVPFINKVLGISNKPRQISYENNPFSNYDVRPMSMGWANNTSPAERTFRF